MFINIHSGNTFTLLSLVFVLIGLSVYSIFSPVSASDLGYPRGARSVAVDPADPAVIYAGTESDRLWKSTDYGRSWTQLSAPVTRLVFALAIAPTTPSVIYAGSYEEGLFKSVDGGTTWTEIGVGIQGMVLTVEIDPHRLSRLYVGSSEGIWKSEDGGGIWQDLSGDLVNEAGIRPFVNAIAVDPVDPSVVYATASKGGLFVPRVFFEGEGSKYFKNGVTNTGLLKSTDNGQRWVRIGRNLWDLDIVAYPAVKVIHPFSSSHYHLPGRMDGTFQKHRRRAQL